ncbi:ParA family protein [Glutamicibacter ardleyensis]|uniref:ParA family protein n=1 Tax=Glutamicibacter ardleyensis TaxID=225894 RepID=UPI003FD6B4C9
MQTIMIASTKGGEGKTTTAVHLSKISAMLGKKTLFIDLDPSMDGTKWFDMEPGDKDFFVGDILSADGTPNKNPDDDPTGWAMSMARQSEWDENLYVLPSHESLGTLELNTDPAMELRLKKSLIGADYDVVIIDCPNRSGGPLLRSALLVADTIIYSATGDEGGYEGVNGARKALTLFQEEQELRGYPAKVEEAGTVFCGYQEVATPRMTVKIIDDLREQGVLLTPLVPARTCVKESRMSRRWVGEWGTKSEPIINAYMELGKKIIK